MRPSSSQQAQGQRHTLQDSEQNKHEALVENSRPWRWRQWSGGPRQAPQRGTRLLAGGPGPHPRTALGRHRAGTAESAPVPTPSRFGRTSGSFLHHQAAHAISLSSLNSGHVPSCELNSVWSAVVWAVAVCGGACARSPASPGDIIMGSECSCLFHKMIAWLEEG